MFNRLNYDNCTYSHNLKQSIGSVDYLLNTPRNDCRACFSTDPSLRMSNSIRSSHGVSTCKNIPLVDVDSDLKLITKPATNCPTKKYIPGKENFCDLKNYPDCDSRDNLPQEDTRISNPTCTLRCTGWNRWEWLCKNPQEKALVPFDFNINNRLVVKDNHRPCLPVPINQVSALPALNGSNDEIQYNPQTCLLKNNDVQSTSWKQCNAYALYA